MDAERTKPKAILLMSLLVKAKAVQVIACIFKI